jgi:hypothetical protein
LSDYPTNSDAESRTPPYDLTGVESLSHTTTPAHAVPDAPASSPSHKAGVAKDQAAGVAGEAKDAAGHVGGVTKEQAGQVASEVKSQAKDLYAQATSELKDQSGTQAQKVSEGLRSVSDELSSMAEKSDGHGVASELVRNLSGRAGSAASWLDGRDPGTLLDDVKSFAARKPGTFIAIAAGAGILAGRLAKSLAAEAKSDTKSAPSASTLPPTAPAREDLFTPASSTYDEYATPTFDDIVDGGARTKRPFEEQR